MKFSTHSSASDSFDACNEKSRNALYVMASGLLRKLAMTVQRKRHCELAKQSGLKKFFIPALCFLLLTPFAHAQRQVELADLLIECYSLLYTTTIIAPPEAEAPPAYVCMEPPPNFYDNFFDFRIGFDLLQIRPATPIVLRDSIFPPLKIPLRLTGEYAELRADGKFHQGVDFSLSIGDTVFSSFCGEVRIEAFHNEGYGNVVVVRNYNMTETLYGHLDKSLVRNGQKVTVGQPIGIGGNTGTSTAPHLHFEIRSAGYSFNPIVRGLFFDKFPIYR